MSITLLELRTRARRRADMENSQFITDPELTDYINSSIAELHDILIQAYDSDYAIAEAPPITTVSGQDQYDLPTDFYKVKGVDAKIDNNNYSTLQNFNFNERNRSNSFTIWNVAGLPHIQYRVLGNKIKFSPIPDKAVEIKLWYIPLATKLVADGDILDDINQFAEYVIVDTAIKMLTKEESDVTVLAAQKLALKRRIEEVANNRDTSNSDSVTDIYAAQNDYLYNGE